MRWRRMGRVFSPTGQYPWMASHAANPVAEAIDGSIFRIYFSCRNAANVSSIGWVMIDLNHPLKVLELSSRPALGPGELGTFDDSGVSVGCLTTDSETVRLYYVGWNLAVTVPWRNSIGLAIKRTGEAEFSRYSPAPILDRSAVDPYSLSYPWVEPGGKRWRMWYGSNLAWGRRPNDMLHVIKYAESEDGISWQRSGHISIPLEKPGEFAISRPCVVKDGKLLRMWYSYRSPQYRIGFAESENGRDWQRRDSEAGLEPASHGWDSEGISYPFVFDHQGERFLLYNGNGFGKTGFGIASLE